VVTRDVPPNTVVVGNPARVIRHLDASQAAPEAAREAAPEAAPEASTEAAPETAGA
jgi:maltose O-acetyltransferase